MLLGAYVATLVAAIIVVVVALVRRPDETATTTVRFQRLSDSSCANLPEGAQLLATIDGSRQRVRVVNGCEAVVRWQTATGQTSFVLEHASDYELANPAQVHWLKGNSALDVPVVQKGTKEPRLKVVLLPYVQTDTSRQSARDLLSRILQSKLTSLSSLMAAREPGAALARLRVVSEDHPSLSLHQLQEKWLKEHLLEIASGIIFTRSGRLVARSEIYLGELADPPSLALDLDLHEDQFGQVNDSHALALVYALAMDAEKIGQPAHVILAYLDQATQLCQQLAASEPGLATLKKSVSSLVRRWNAEAAAKCR